MFIYRIDQEESVRIVNEIQTGCCVDFCAINFFFVKIERKDLFGN